MQRPLDFCYFQAISIQNCLTPSTPALSTFEETTCQVVVVIKYQNGNGSEAAQTWLGQSQKAALA